MHVSRGLLFCVAASLAAFCGPGGLSASAGESAPITKGGVRLYVKEKRIEMDGRFCLTEGPIELFVCAKGGKEYESVIAVEANPEILHFCLLLLKLKPGETGPKFQGDPDRVPTGSPVVVTVTWWDESVRDVGTQKSATERIEKEGVTWTHTKLTDDGRHVVWTNDGRHVATWDKSTKELIIWSHPSKERPAGRGKWTVRAEHLCWNMIDKRTMLKTPWVFVGSKKHKDPDTGRTVYWANVEKSLITVFRDPFAVLDLPLSLGADDDAYVVNTQIVPRRGTPCTVILTPGEKVKPRRNAAGGRIFAADITAGGRVLIDGTQPPKLAEALKKIAAGAPKDSCEVTIDHGPAAGAAAALEALGAAGVKIESVRTVRLQPGVNDLITVTVSADGLRVKGRKMSGEQVKAAVRALAAPDERETPPQGAAAPAAPVPAWKIVGVHLDVKKGATLKQVAGALRACTGIEGVMLRLTWRDKAPAAGS